MYVCLLHVCWGLKRCEEGIGFPGAGVSDQPELIPCESGTQEWDPSLALLREQQVLLTLGPPLQLQKTLF